MTNTPRRIHRCALVAAAGAGGLLSAVTGAAYAFQRELLYDPGHDARRLTLKGEPVQAVRLKTADHERLTGWHLPPVGDRPVMLFLNGRVGGLAIQAGRWRRIARQGVGFLAINYRGYGGSSGRPTEHGLNLDARAAHAWLSRRFPPERIVIHGYSLGSGVAVRLAADHAARALVLEAPFTALDEVVDEKAMGLPVGLLLRDRYRSRDWIGRVTAPVLIVHGDKDSVVPFEEGRALFALAHEPKAFVRIAGGDHNTLTRDGLYDHVWRFLGVTPP
jgi:hypothetical protein